MIHLLLITLSLVAFGIGWAAKGLAVEREESRREEARWAGFDRLHRLTEEEK